jgi:hypothetical protein
MINHQFLFVRDQSGQDAQQLGNDRTDIDTRVLHGKELIDETGSSNEKGTNNPRSECAGGQIWVIVVFDHSTDLGVWRVLDASYQRPTYAVRIGLRLTAAIRAVSISSSW